MPKGEKGSGGAGAACSTQAGIPATLMGATARDRRVLIVPVVNCLANGVTWSKKNIPIIGFAELFLSEPVGLRANGWPDPAFPFSTDVYAEFVDMVKPGNDGGTLRDLAQLYR